MFDFKTIYIIHIIITIFLLIKYYQLSNNQKIVENMSASNIDYEALKNLGVIARGLQKGGYTIPGNLTVNGNLNVNNKTTTKGLSSGTIDGTYYIKSSDANLYLHTSGGSRSAYHNTLHPCPKRNNHGNCQWQFQKSTTR